MTESGFDRKTTLQLLAFSKDLPSLPDYFMKIQQVVQSPDSSARDMATVIRCDQATSAMVLKIANSAVFNPVNIPISELSRAIARLGSLEVAHIATTMSLMHGINLPTSMTNIRIFWARAFGTAIVAEWLAHKLDPVEEHCSHECAFMTGLFHEIGRAALGMRVDISYFARDTGHLYGDALIQAEEDYYGVNHAEAGKYLLQMWNLPEPVYLAVGECHNAESQLFPAKLCYIADQFIHTHLPEHTALESIHETVMKALKESPPDLTAFSASS